MLRKKILYFDYWTVGISNFKLFDRRLKSQGYETKLLHLSSWRGIKAPTHEVIEGIECFDIKFYDSPYLHEILKKEKPRAVVILNASFITDRTIILSCKKLGIRSAYLMHGALTREDFIEENIKTVNQSLKWSKYKRGLRHVKGTVLNYLNSTLKYNPGNLFQMHPFRVLFNTLVNPGQYLHFPPAAFDLKPDLTLVYGLTDYAFYTNRLQFLEHSVKVVGNPDLDQFFQELDKLPQNKDQFFKTYNIPANQPYITYIEEGLVEDRIWKNEYRIEFLSQLSEACLEAGFHLVIKLHPRTARGCFLHSFRKLKNTTVLSTVNFPKLIHHTEKCVSHYSTTLIYAMLLGKPILIPKWGKSAELPNLYSEREVTFVSTFEEFRNLISSKNGFQYDRDEYIRNLVPYRDGKTAERISDHILALVQ